MNTVLEQCNRDMETVWESIAADAGYVAAKASAKVQSVIQFELTDSDANERYKAVRATKNEKNRPIEKIAHTRRIDALKEALNRDLADLLAIAKFHGVKLS